MMETHSRYVEFNSNIFSTFFVEFLKLCQVVCSEIDVFAKTLARDIDPDFKADKVDILK